MDLRRATIAVLVALIALAGFALRQWLQPGQEPPPAAPQKEPQSVGPAPVAATQAPQPTPRSRSRIPRPVTTRKASAPQEADALQAEENAAKTSSDTGGPRPGVAGAPVPKEQASEAINAAVLPTLGDIRQCLELWGAEYPEISGDLTLELDLGSGGLEEVWIMDHSDVPGGILSCFGSTLYQAAWPSFAEDLRVEYPFHFELTQGDDSGT